MVRGKYSNSHLNEMQLGKGITEEIPSPPNELHRESSRDWLGRLRSTTVRKRKEEKDRERGETAAPRFSIKQGTSTVPRSSVPSSDLAVRHPKYPGWHGRVVYVCVRTSVSLGSASCMCVRVETAILRVRSHWRVARVCMCEVYTHTRVRFPFRDSRSRIPKKMAAMKAYGGDVDVVRSKAASRPREA